MSLTVSYRKIKESPWGQAEGEKIAYEIDVLPFGTAAPTSPSVTIFDPKGVDQSASLLAGSASVNGSIITTPFVQGLRKDQKYRLVIAWADGDALLSCYGEIIGEPK